MTVDNGTERNRLAKARYIIPAPPAVNVATNQDTNPIQKSVIRAIYFYTLLFKLNVLSDASRFLTGK